MEKLYNFARRKIWKVTIIYFYKSFSIFITLSYILFFFIVALNVSSSTAAIKTPPKVVIGVVEDITSSSIEVKGKYYDISGATFFNMRGGKVSRDLLKRGNQVEIIIEDGKVTRVLIDNRNTMQ